MNRELLIAILFDAYDLGAHAVKVANRQRGWSQSQEKMERAALNRLLREAGYRPPLSDAEYEPFNR